MPAILDEIQNAPEVLNYVRSRIDTAPEKKGRWLLTGSQEIGLMLNVSESMAGRAAILQLLPLSRVETPKVGLLAGGYLEALARPRDAALWYASYVPTDLERDVRALIASCREGSSRIVIRLCQSRQLERDNQSTESCPPVNSGSTSPRHTRQTLW